ncbi:MAG: carbonic anhydrase family protein [Flavobacteriaceae bacterium]
MPTQTAESQSKLTPDDALAMLKEGNQRFLNGTQRKRELNQQVIQTAKGQYPFASIVGCIDSRVPQSLIFDQGIGSLFSAKVAGNIINDDILGSLEFACKLAGSKVVVVLGHTSCGAVKGACDQAELGNLTALLSKINPAVLNIKEPQNPELRNSKNSEFVDAVALENVKLTVQNIRTYSNVLRGMEEEGAIKIVGAMYDVKTGEVSFLD